MEFVPINSSSAESIKAVRRMGCIPGNVYAYASPEDFIAQSGVGPPQDDCPRKFWRDVSAIWRGQGAPDYKLRYVGLARDASGDYVRELVDFSDESFRFYSQHAANFYRLYASHFRRIPKLRMFFMTPEHARKMNFEKTTVAPSELPIADIADDGTHSFPPDIALRFNPTTGEPEAFRWPEYVQAYPLDWTPRIIDGTNLTDEEAIAAVRQILSMAGISPRDQRQYIRTVVR